MTRRCGYEASSAFSTATFGCTSLRPVGPASSRTLSLHPGTGLCADSLKRETTIAFASRYASHVPW